MIDEIAPDPIAPLHVVDKLDHLRVRRLVEVDVRRHCRVLRDNQKLEANRASLVLQLDGELAPQLHNVVFGLIREADADCAAFDGRVALQEALQVWAQQVDKLVVWALLKQKRHFVSLGHLD